MTDYPTKSMLRFYPSGAGQPHYTATVMKDGSVFEVKSPDRAKAVYESLEAWLESLPGSPKAHALKVDTNPPKKEPKERPEKKKKEMPAKLNVPSMKSDSSTRWARHIYQMMKEANKELLKKPEVITAFNNLVTTLLMFSGKFVTYAYSNKNKYSSGINIENEQNRWDTLCGIPGSIHYQYYNYSTKDTTLRTQIITDVKAAYAPLYELIKRDVVPYMERKNWDNNISTQKKIYAREIEKNITKLDALKKRYEFDIAKYEKQIAIYSEKMATVDKGFKPTVFPPVENTSS